MEVRVKKMGLQKDFVTILVDIPQKNKTKCFPSLSIRPSHQAQRDTHKANSSGIGDFCQLIICITGKLWRICVFSTFRTAN